MEASALTHASRRGLLARRSPLLKLQGDEKLIAMVRNGNPGAFETIVDRYQGRLLGFCRQMLGSTEDAEDVLQEVFVNAYKAMLADEREINLRPWLYRIARNRCLNHLRKPTADAQESMDMVPAVEASSTAERVHNREEFRQLLADVKKLPETQRSALLLREMDALSYEEIAAAMETTVPSVKSLLVRARISLAEASQARLLTCGEVRIELSEAAEGLVKKVSAPVRRHVRECEECADFRSQVRSNEKAMAALFPVGGLIALKGFILTKLGLGGGGAAGGTAGAGAAGAGAAGAGAAGVGAAISGGSAAGGLGAIGGAIGTKAVAGVVTAAVITAGAVEVNKHQSTGPVDPPAAKISHVQVQEPTAPAIAPAVVSEPQAVVHEPEAATAPAVEETPAEPAAEPAPVALDDEASAQAAPAEETVGGTNPTVEAVTVATPPAGTGTTAGAHGSGNTVVVTVVSTTPPPAAAPPAEPAPAPVAPPAEEVPAEEVPAGDGEAPIAEEPVLP
ncbi:MAG TPA: RNA polymerase sigma factor [Solirubrobacterales bacterium]|nr:RNA polymerase sigma factor [Solirubrobacterales bacterium]